ncbi:MAG: hypothetical protein ACLU48_10535 [Clostridiaceae bacterium]
MEDGIQENAVVSLDILSGFYYIRKEQFWKIIDAAVICEPVVDKREPAPWKHSERLGRRGSTFSAPPERTDRIGWKTVRECGNGR